MPSFVTRLIRGIASRDMAGNISLEGYFDLRARLLTGKIRKVSNALNIGLHVHLLRDRTILAEAEADIITPGDFATFFLPLPVPITEEDIVRETVKIEARNARGDSGWLRLNGATQLELIRDYMGKSSETLFDIDFSILPKLPFLLGEGWCSPEVGHTWTSGTKSYVRIDHPQVEVGTLHLRMNVGAFINSFVLVQLMEISINEVPIASFSKNYQKSEFRQFQFDASVIENKPFSILTISCPNAYRPCDSGNSPDARRLAFSFHRISIIRIREDE